MGGEASEVVCERTYRFVVVAGNNFVLGLELNHSQAALSRRFTYNAALARLQRKEPSYPPSVLGASERAWFLAACSLSLSVTARPIRSTDRRRQKRGRAARGHNSLIVAEFGRHPNGRSGQNQDENQDGQEMSAEISKRRMRPVSM